jgi:hypothetical protein
MKLYEKYLLQEKTFKQSVEGALKELSKMSNSDELDDKATDLMMAIENQGYKINDDEKDPKKHNDRIKQIKKATNLISDMVDSKNKQSYIKKIMKVVNTIFDD